MPGSACAGESQHLHTGLHQTAPGKIAEGTGGTANLRYDLGADWAWTPANCR